VPLVGPQGIFTPAILQLPLTITTAPPVQGKEPAYDDQVGEDGLLRYRYRGTDVRHRDNVGVRELMRRGIPLIYLLAHLVLVELREIAHVPVEVLGLAGEPVDPGPDGRVRDQSEDRRAYRSNAIDSARRVELQAARAGRSVLPAAR
jgi:hypothetical protein